MQNECTSSCTLTIRVTVMPVRNTFLNEQALKTVSYTHLDV
ncbi:hypothetical protein [Erwinia amylovora]